MSKKNDDFLRKRNPSQWLKMNYWVVILGLKLRVRFSLDNLKPDDDVLKIPLFMIDQAD